METAVNEAYVLPKAGGVSDVWFPLWDGRYITKVSARQSDGCLVQVLVDEPRGAAPPLHIHHDSDETWYVLGGELTVLVGDERFEAGPGDFVFGPRGVPHTFIVTSDRAEFLATFGPAGTEGPRGCGADGFFREIGLPVVAERSHPGAVAVSPEEFARKAARYGIEIVGPPPTLESL